MEIFGISGSTLSLLGDFRWPNNVLIVNTAHDFLQLRSHPKEIISEVMRTLRDLDINWKKTAAYNLKCRWVVPGQSSNDKVSANHGITDSPMAGSMPRVSSGRWSAEHHGGPGSVAAGNKDNESGVESNVLKFELQVCLVFLCLFCFNFFSTFLNVYHEGPS